METNVLNILLGGGGKGRDGGTHNVFIIYMFDATPKQNYRSFGEATVAKCLR